MANLMLPKQIDPILLAEDRKSLKGELALAEMSRLKNLAIVEQTGFVYLDFKFGRDESGYAYLRGTIKGNLYVNCERCNSPMQLALDILVSVSPVRTSAQAKQLPSCYEPLLLTENTVSLAEVVEEEILLSLPIVPKHSAEECNVKSLDLTEEEDKDKPFNVLKKLLRE